METTKIELLNSITLKSSKKLIISKPSLEKITLQKGNIYSRVKSQQKEKVFRIPY